MKRLKTINPKIAEISIYTIIWLFILAELAFVKDGDTMAISDHFLQDALKALPIFILFVINSVWLIPNLLFEKKTLLYVGFVVVLSVFFVVSGELIFDNQPPQRIEHRDDFKPMKPDTFFHEQNQPPMFEPNHHGEFKPKNPPFMGNVWGIGFFNRIIVCLLIISLNTAIKVTFKWFKDEHDKREIEKDFLKAELTMLQNQISPHFFMNTLNNIHALVEINATKAQLSIVKLSRMMRYLLYESDQGVTTLQKEIEFLNSYVDLMKLRIDETVTIELSVPEDYQNVSFPPLLLMPFIENAFKHGISYREQSYITIKLEQVGRFIVFHCTNRKLTQTKPEKSAGIGLKNVQKRLDLIFGKSYSLAINDKNSDYTVKLIIPVNDN